MIRTALVSLALCALVSSAALAQGAQDAQERERAAHLGAAHIANGLAIGSSLKMHVMEYYMMMGEFPNSNEDVGMGDPRSLGSGALKSAAVERGGTIVLTYGPASGVNGGQVRLIPKDGRARVEWQCTTRDYPRLPQFAPQCTHRGSPASQR